MAKLWQKNYSLDKEIEKFTVGNDFVLDKNLIKHDVYGSIAHAAMLNKIGILDEDELKKLKKALTEILNLSKNNQFDISQEDEDVHTAIENCLVKKLGDLGKKIHTARSRNDQVLVDLRLYSKEKILQISLALIDLLSSLIEFAQKNKDIPMPGYTHTRKAMPSSVGLLFGAYAESLLDNSKILKLAYNLNDQNPLGSATGYGINLDIDRELTTRLLGFKKVQNNALYVQNSRGKIESVIVFSLSKIMEDICRISNDFTLFSTEEFGYFTLPDEFTTGSSLMPHKKNPDVLELLRAKESVVESNLFQINSIVAKLPSGYNRDLQLTKEPLIESFETTLSCINILKLVIKGLKANKENCTKSFTKDLFATDDVMALVKKGHPLREAYKEVAKDISKVKMQDPIKNILSKKHLGATGNLGFGEIEKQIKSLKGNIDSEIKKFDMKIKFLLR